MVTEMKYLFAIMSDKLGEISIDLHVFAVTALECENVHNISVNPTHLIVKYCFVKVTV